MAVVRRAHRSLTVDAAPSVRVFSEVAQDQSLDAGHLTAAAVDEIRSLKNPPSAVRRILEVVHLVLHARRHPRGVPRDGVKWESVLRTLATEDLVQRLQDFDIEELRQNPVLARDLHDIYFSNCDASEYGQRARIRTRTKHSAFDAAEWALNPERVRRASTAAVALFSWAARTVEQAAPPPEPLLPPLLSPRLESEPEEPSLETTASFEHLPPLVEVPEVQVETEEPEADAPLPQRLTVGVWACCPNGHGLIVGCGGLSPTCEICRTAVTRGGDSAVCRECNYFVCVVCRRGDWFNLEYLGAVGSDSTTTTPVEFEVVGFRFIRTGEDFPTHLNTQEFTAPGAVAVWGPQSAVAEEAAEMLGDESFRARLRLSVTGAQTTTEADVPAGAGMDCVVEWPNRRRRGAATQRSSMSASGVFGLTDSRALGATILVGLRGYPGVQMRPRE